MIEIPVNEVHSEEDVNEAVKKFDKMMAISLFEYLSRFISTR